MERAQQLLVSAANLGILDFSNLIADDMLQEVDKRRGKTPGIALAKLIQELSNLRWLAQPFLIFIGPLGLHPGSQACI